MPSLSDRARTRLLLTAAGVGALRSAFELSSSPALASTTCGCTGAARTTMRRALLTAFTMASLCAPALVPAVSLGATRRDTGGRSVLLTQSATGGSLKPARGHRMTLTLRGVAPQVVWFQDRPNRRAGHMSATEFASRWRSFGFRSDAPNAALSLLDAPDNADTVIVELLHRPRYNPVRRTMTYVVRRLSGASGQLAGFEDDGRIPARFAAATLFIDAADGQQVDAGPAPGAAVADAFASPSPVAVPGGVRAIGDIQVGDEVMSVDAEGEPTSATVLFSDGAAEGTKIMTYVDYGDDQVLLATPESLLATGQQPPGELVQAGQLAPGDQLVGMNGESWRVNSVQTGDYQGDVHRLVVEGTGWYFVGGLLVEGPQLN